ncbi:MAG TPA: SgcJ/EcaC family oxidoreductase [Burkholderiales bacterium]|nr:SgcJ/EcaC family oxidoreductase [Burkholderiales bacterium]
MKAFVPLALVAAAGAVHAADVTVIRQASIISADWSYYILVGSDQPITDLRSGERATFKVPNGPAALVVHCPGPLAGHYEESRLDYVFGDAPAWFVIEPAPHCVKIQALDARQAGTHLARSRERSVRLMEYEKPIEPPKVAKGAAPAVAAAPPSPAVAASRDAIAAATAAWVDAFNSREPARLSALYDADAVLLDLDTRSPVSGSGAIARHYAGATQRPTARVALGERSIRLLGETAIDSGTATIFEMRDGNATTTPVRYSLTYRNHGGKWLIVDHHLSPAPR